VDPDVVWGGEWGRSSMGGLDGSPRASRERDSILGFSPHWFEWHILTKMYSTRALKVEDISIWTMHRWNLQRTSKKVRAQKVKVKVVYFIMCLRRFTVQRHVQDACGSAVWM